MIKDKFKYTIKDMESIAIKRGGRCLSFEYSGYDTFMNWSCSHGHEWESSPRYILRGHWCSVCNRNKRQEFCRYVFELLTGRKFILSKKKFDEYKYHLEIDGFNEDLMIGFEYQGEQHYKITNFSKTEDILNDIKRRDEMKSNLFDKNGMRILYVKYTLSDNDIVETIKDFLFTNGIEYINCDIIFDDFYSKYSYLKNKVESISKIIEDKNGELISYDLKDCTIRCNNNHIWTTKFYTIKSGHWCRKCADSGITENYEDFSEKIETYGFKMISDKNNFNESDVRISCKCGNIIEIGKRKLNNIMNNNRSVCRICLKKNKLSSESYSIMKEISLKSNICFLDIDEFKNKKSIVNWTCLKCNSRSSEPLRNIVNRYQRNTKNVCKCCL